MKPEELRALLERATATPWDYRPYEHDEHRRNRTDPYEPNGKLIVAAVNALPGLLSRIEALEEALTTIRDGRVAFNGRQGGVIETWRELARTTLTGERS